MGQRDQSDMRPGLTDSNVVIPGIPLLPSSHGVRSGGTISTANSRAGAGVVGWVMLGNPTGSGFQPTGKPPDEGVAGVQFALRH